MKISQEALDAARSIGSYCGSRFQQDVSAMLDVPWFAEKVQIAIDASMPAAPTPQPITADWLRENGWEEKPPYGDWTLALCGASSVFLIPSANTTGHFNVYFDNSIVWSFIRPVTDTADLANLVAALRGGAK